MHFQADAMACTVEESVRRLGLRVGRKAISVKYLRDGFMDLCTGDAGPEHGQGGLLGFVDGVKSAANDFWRFAFDYGAGQVAAIAGRIVPREDVQRDWRVCLDGAVALLVRVSSLLAVGGDRVGRCAATARDFSGDFALESFCQEGLSLQEQNPVPTDFRLSENIKGAGKALFGKADAVADVFDFLGAFASPARAEVRFWGEREAALAQLGCQAIREVRGHFPGVDLQMASHRDDVVYHLASNWAAAHAPLPSRLGKGHDLDARMALLDGAADFENADDNRALILDRIPQKWVRSRKTSLIKKVSAAFAGSIYKTAFDFFSTHGKSIVATCGLEDEGG